MELPGYRSLRFFTGIPLFQWAPSSQNRSASTGVFLAHNQAHGPSSDDAGTRARDLGFAWESERDMYDLQQWDDDGGVALSDSPVGTPARSPEVRLDEIARLHQPVRAPDDMKLAPVCQACEVSWWPCPTIKLARGQTTLEALRAGTKHGAP